MKRIVFTYYSRKVILIFALLFCSIAYGQQKRNWTDLHKLYISNLEKYLCPPIDSLSGKEAFIFIAKPSFEPEFSICMVRNKDQSYLEARFVKKNLWYDKVINEEMQKTKIVSPEVNLYTIRVSQGFVNKTQTLFTELKGNKTPPVNERQTNADGIYQVEVDGISYLLWIIDEKTGNLKTELKNPKAGTVEAKTVEILTKIAVDIKTQTFEESKINFEEN